MFPSPDACFDSNTCTILVCFLSSQYPSVMKIKYHKETKVQAQAAAALANTLLSQAFRKHIHRQGSYAADSRPEVKHLSLEASFPDIRGSKSLGF